MEVNFLLWKKVLLLIRLAQSFKGKLFSKILVVGGGGGGTEKSPTINHCITNKQFSKYIEILLTKCDPYI